MDAPLKEICLICGEEYYSLFDRLYVKEFGRCVLCTTCPEDVEENGNIIFDKIDKL